MPLTRCSSASWSTSGLAVLLGGRRCGGGRLALGSGRLVASAVLGRAVLGRAVLGRAVLGLAVLVRAVLGRAVLGRSGLGAAVFRVPSAPGRPLNFCQSPVISRILRTGLVGCAPTDSQYWARSESTSMRDGSTLG